MMEETKSGAFAIPLPVGSRSGPQLKVKFAPKLVERRKASTGSDSSVDLLQQVQDEVQRKRLRTEFDAKREADRALQRKQPASGTPVTVKREPGYSTGGGSSYGGAGSGASSTGWQALAMDVDGAGAEAVKLGPQGTVKRSTYAPIGLPLTVSDIVAASDSAPRIKGPDAMDDVPKVEPPSSYPQVLKQEAPHSSPSPDVHPGSTATGILKALLRPAHELTDQCVFLQLPSHLPLSPPTPDAAVLAEAKKRMLMEDEMSRRQNIKAEPGTGGTDGTAIKPQDGILDDAVVPPVSASSTAPSTSSEVDALVRRMKMMRFGQLFSKNQEFALPHLPVGCMGKLVAYKSGRVEFVAGDVRFNVSAATPSLSNQQLVSLSSDPSQFVTFGSLHHRLVCSLDTDSLLESS